MFVESAPILPTVDMAASISFWRGLGLNLIFSDADDPGKARHVTLEKEGLSIHLELSDASAGNPAPKIRVNLASKAAVIALHEDMLARGLISGQLRERDWADLVFNFRSPEGAEFFCYVAT